jgi:Predicted permease.
LANAVYFSLQPRLAFPSQNGIDTIDKIFKSDANINEIGAIKYFFGSPVGDNITNIQFFAFSDGIIQNLKLPLSSGKWFSKSYRLSNQIPVILGGKLSSSYHVGDTIKINYVNVDDNIDKTEIELLVIGIINKYNYTIYLGAGGDDLGLNEIFSTLEDYYAIIPLDNKNLPANLNYQDECGRILLFSNKSICENHIKELKNNLKDYGCFYTIKELKSNYIKFMRSKISKQVIILLFVFALALAGLGGNNALSQLFREKEFAIYFLCGSRWSYCVSLVLFGNLIIITIPLIILYPILRYISISKYSGKVMLDMNNIIWSLSLVIGILLITSLGSLIRLYKRSPVSIIRRWH